MDTYVNKSKNVEQNIFSQVNDRTNNAASIRLYDPNVLKDSEYITREERINIYSHLDDDQSWSIKTTENEIGVLEERLKNLKNAKEQEKLNSKLAKLKERDAQRKEQIKGKWNSRELINEDSINAEPINAESVEKEEKDDGIEILRNEIKAKKKNLKHMKERENIRKDTLDSMQNLSDITGTTRSLDDRKKAMSKYVKNVKEIDRQTAKLNNATKLSDKIKYLKKIRDAEALANRRIVEVYGEKGENEKIKIKMVKFQANVSLREKLTSLFYKCTTKKDENIIEAEIAKIDTENLSLSKSFNDVCKFEKELEDTSEQMSEKERTENERITSECQKSRKSLNNMFRTDKGSRLPVEKLFTDITMKKFNSPDSIESSLDDIKYMIVYGKREIRLALGTETVRERKQHVEYYSKQAKEQIGEVDARDIEEKARELEDADVEAINQEMNTLDRLVRYGQVLRRLRMLYLRSDYLEINRMRKEIFEGKDFKYDNMIKDDELLNSFAQRADYTDSHVYRAMERIDTYGYRLNMEESREEAGENGVKEENVIYDKDLEDMSRDVDENLENVISYRNSRISLKKEFDNSGIINDAMKTQRKNERISREEDVEHGLNILLDDDKIIESQKLTNKTKITGRVAAKMKEKYQNELEAVRVEKRMIELDNDMELPAPLKNESDEQYLERIRREEITNKEIMNKLNKEDQKKYQELMDKEIEISNLLKRAEKSN